MRFALIALALLGAALAPAASGQSLDDPNNHGGISVQLGAGPRAQRTALNWETPVLWRHSETGVPGRVDLTGEFGVAYWSATGGREPASVWQVSAIPMLRWWPGGGRFFVEGGIGPTLFSHTEFAGRSMSTAFQFGDHLGVGYQFTPALRASLRLSHFSNADIKQPNPGLNVLQLTCTLLY